MVPKPNQPQSGQKGKTAMAITNEQVLAAVSTYRAENGRPCPKHYLTGKFGDEVLAVIDTLKGNGTLVGKRGRSGGLVTADAAPAATETAAVDSTVKDQFEALASQLLAESEPADSAVG